MDSRQFLISGIGELGLSATEDQLTALLHFQEMMVKWNKVYNLTAITDPLQMVTHHLLDSLAVLPYLHGQRIIDVGTGGGLPGIPLAIMCPEREFVLLDSNNKKTRFVTQAKIELKLANVTVQNSRVEAYRPEAQFDTVVSRAFASLVDMLTWTADLCAPQGQFLAMKGVCADEELAEVPAGFNVLKKQAITVPGLEAERHVVLITADVAQER